MKLSVRAVTIAAVIGVPGLRATADARPASTGWYAEGGLAAEGFLPPANDDAKLGPALDVRFGRDLFSWLSVGIYAAAASHLETVPAPPSGEWFQLYHTGADARLTLPLSRIALFVDGGIGVAVLSSNVLDKVDISKPGTSYSFELHGGGGGEYQLENRHYAIGLGADAYLQPQFASVKQLEGRLYLRYTY